MEDVFSGALDLVRQREQGALATVVAGKGSLPMSKRAKMLVRPDGSITGTVGGGCLEAEVWAEARRVMETGKAVFQTFTLTAETAEEEGLTCGGSVEILIEPLIPRWPGEILEPIAELRRGGRTALLATVLDGEDPAAGGLKMLFFRDGSTTGSLGDTTFDTAAAEAAARHRQFADDLIEIFRPFPEGPRILLESIAPDPVLFLFGGGHISLALARIAKMAGFRVVVIDDRPAFANRERFPEADETLVMEMEGALSRLKINRRSYIVAVTRGHQHDKTVIRQAAKIDAAYVGMIGSRRKIKLMWKELEAEGIGRERLEAIHAPVGLSIGADTPEEIAVAIMAEIIQTRRKTMGKQVKVYGTSTCPMCQRVKSFLKEKGVEFENIDLAIDRERIQEMKDLSGQSGVPVTVVDGEVVVGFDRPRLEKALGGE